MKKFVLIFIAFFAIALPHAQLTNSRWKSTVIIDAPVNAIFDFRKDTCMVYTVADSTMIETMIYSKDDTSFTLKKIDGQSDCDNNTPGKYRFKISNDILYLKMIADDCYDRSSVIDSTKWTKWKDHHEVKVDDAILKQYVGVYQLDAAHPITISWDNGRLYAEGPNNNLSKSPLLAESNIKFFLKVAGVEWNFVTAANGKVVKLVSHEEKDYELKKVQ
jgi:hypothetical protein